MSHETTTGDLVAPSLRVVPTPRSVPVELGSLVAGALESTAIKPDYLMPGLVVNGAWVVESKIGVGGMGAVYLVKNAHTNPPKHFALKLSLPGSAEESEAERIERVKRCEREAGLVFVLNHPNIVKPLSFFAWPDPESGHPCIVMPYVRGETLGTHCRKNAPTLRTILSQLLRPIADALDYIHEKDIYHRDIKPSNVMVRADDGVPLLMDFGIARANAATTLTSTEVMATFEFGAPEYLRWSSSIERYSEVPFSYQGQCDLFCLGGTFFDVLTGQLPYQHVAGVGEPGGVLGPIFQNALKGFEPETASRLNPAIPPEVDALLAKLMARDAAERFQTGAEVVAAVDELLSGLAGPHALLDAPFVCPPRIRVTKGSSQSTAQRRRPSSARSAPQPNVDVIPPTPPPQSRQPSLAMPSGRSVVGSLVAPSFRAPLDADESPAFREPIELPVASPVASRDEEVMPTAFRRAREQLQHVRAPNERQKSVVLALGLLVLVLLILIVALSSRPRDALRVESLLDAKEPPLANAPRPAMPLPAEMAPPVSPRGEEVEGVAPPSQHPSGQVRARRAPSTDAAEIDALLKSEYGGERPVVGGPSSRAVPVRSSWVLGANSGEAPIVADNKRLGVPTGTEIPVRLQKPLDSRTVSSGPAVARLMRPLTVRGGVVLPTGTMVYGTASASGAGRFDAHFNRLRFADGRELKFEGIAYDLDDKKPGLRATSRIQNAQSSSPTLGETLVKGAAGTLLGKVGDADGVDVVRGAGQTVLNHDSRSQSSSAEALLLEAPMDFTVFVLDAF